MISHSHNKDKVKAVKISIFSNTTLIVGKLFVGIMINSVSIISEAVHSAIDLMAALVAYFSIKEANKPADSDHPYGHGKMENISGIIESILILLAAIFIIHQSYEKIRLNELVGETSLGLAVMLFSVVVNILVSSYLFKVAKKTQSIALEADAWHLRTDVYTSVGIFAGLLLIKFTGYHILDPIVAIIVAFWLLIISVKLTLQSLKDILDTKLSTEEEKKIFDVLREHENLYISYHKVRSRRSGSERFVDFHLVVPSHWDTQKTHDISHTLENEIKKVLPQTQLIIHIEPCKKRTNQCFEKCRCDHCSLDIKFNK